MTGNCLQFGLNISFLDEKVPKHRLALSIWVEHKLFKGKDSKMTGNCLQFGLNISFTDEKDPKQREAFTKLVRIPAFQE